MNKTSINTDFIEAICREEHLALLEKTGSYYPELETVAQALKDYFITEITFGDIKVPDFNLLKTILNKLQVDLLVTPLPDGAQAILIPEGDKNRTTIVLSKSLSMTEACFIIGHEIGHIVLSHKHKSMLSGTSFESCRQYLKNEHEADYIAGALLIDERAFRSEHEIDIHNIENFSLKYNVSYETAAHRIALLLDIDMHFFKIDHKGQIIKRFAKTMGRVNWLHMKRLCTRWGIMKVFKTKSDRCFAQKSILLDADKNQIDTLYCVSKFIEDKYGKYAIALGCKYKDAAALTGFVDNLAEVKISGLSCPYPRTCGLKLCFTSFAPV